MSWSDDEREERLASTLAEMNRIFKVDPEAAVRSQEFIQTFHNFIAEDLRAFLTKKAVRAGVKVVEEARIFGSFKSKDVDVAVVHPTNGPLILLGVRSQMSSVGKNVLTYYQDIVGEAISLQERFPMCTTGYAYLHPLEVIPWQKKDGKWTKSEQPNHSRYSRMYAGIGDRDDRLYKHQTGAYDEFAYAVVDFQSDPIRVRDDIVQRAVNDLDMSIRTFVPRLIETFHSRNLWVTDIFEPTNDEAGLEADSDAGLDELEPIDA
ncbi:hypothetical protein JT358_17185 [Micrococcales bacterium 31B]|nr:hypothetical protein [Micrococcales bacterium 31B]